MSLALPAASTAIALTEPVWAMLIAPLYVRLDDVGSDPSIVYLIVPSLELSATFCAEVYVPPATFARGAFGAVVSLLTSPPMVLPLPNGVNAEPTRMGPSARPASELAGTVDVHDAPPKAGAVTVLPAESIRLTRLANAPGCATPLIVRSWPALAWLMSVRLAVRASLGEYGAPQPPKSAALPPAS